MNVPPLLSRLGFLALVSLLSIVPATAQDPAGEAFDEKAALAEKLLTLFDMDKNMEAAFAQVTLMEEKMMDQDGLSDDEKAKRRAVMDASLAETRKIMSWDAIKGDFVKIYADVFSAEELQGMIDFFKGPVGQKFIGKQPQVQAAVMQRMQSLMLEMQPKIRAAIEKARAASAGETAE